MVPRAVSKIITQVDEILGASTVCELDSQPAIEEVDYITDDRPPEKDRLSIMVNVGVARTSPNPGVDGEISARSKVQGCTVLERRCRWSRRHSRPDRLLPATNAGLLSSVPLFEAILSLALFSIDHQLTSPAGTVAHGGVGSSSWIVSTAVAGDPSDAPAPVTPDNCRLIVSSFSKRVSPQIATLKVFDVSLMPKVSAPLVSLIVCPGRAATHVTGSRAARNGEVINGGRRVMRAGARHGDGGVDGAIGFRDVVGCRRRTGACSYGICPCCQRCRCSQRHSRSPPY